VRILQVTVAVNVSVESRVSEDDKYPLRWTHQQQALVGRESTRVELPNSISIGHHRRVRPAAQPFTNSFGLGQSPADSVQYTVCISARQLLLDILDLFYAFNRDLSCHSPVLTIGVLPTDAPWHS
jgi:hypothetical protein